MDNPRVVFKCQDPCCWHSRPLVTLSPLAQNLEANESTPDLPYFPLGTGLLPRGQQSSLNNNPPLTIPCSAHPKSHIAKYKGKNRDPAKHSRLPWIMNGARPGCQSNRSKPIYLRKSRILFMLINVY